MAKKKNKKGFTLVELLVTIAIITLISGIAITMYMKTVNNSKEKAAIIAINNLKKAAELYSNEDVDEIKWITGYKNLEPSYEYTCISVQQLINAGYFNEKNINNEYYNKHNITNNTYLEVSRNLNYSKLSVDIKNNTIDYTKCMSSAINKQLENIKVEDLKVYTDKIIFRPTYNQHIDNAKFYIKYNNNGEKEEECINNICNLDSLIKYTTYPITLCIKNDNDYEYCEKLSTTTKDLEKPIISISNKNIWTKSKIITVDYNKENIYPNEEEYYYYSLAKATVKNGNFYKCQDYRKECSETATNTIDADNWYKVVGNSPKLQVGEEGYNISSNKIIKALISDKTGNSSNEKDNINRIDNISPTKPIITNPNNSNNNIRWVNYDFTLTINSEDEDSGIAYYQYTYFDKATKTGTDDTTSWVTYNNSNKNTYITPEFSKERNQNVYIRVCDNVGNCSEKNSTMIKIDKTKPTKPIITNPNNSNNNIRWVNYNFALTINSEDEDSGIAYYQYTYFDKATKTGTDNTNSWVTYNNSNKNTYITPEFSKERNQNVYIRVCDNAENCSEKNSTMIKIDKTKPTKPIITNPNNSNNNIRWVNYNFALTINSEDKDSGIAYYQYTYFDKATKTGTDNTNSWITYNNSNKNTYITPEFSKERNQNVYIRVCDNAENCSEKNSTMIKIDKTKPTVDKVSYSGLGVNTVTININGAKDTGGSGIEKYYFWIKNGDEIDERNNNISSFIFKDLKSKYYYIHGYVRDKAGNQSDDKYTSKFCIAGSYTVPKKSYSVGTQISYACENWRVIKNNTNDVLLVLDRAITKNEIEIAGIDVNDKSFVGTCNDSICRLRHCAWKKNDPGSNYCWLEGKPDSKDPNNGNPKAITNRTTDGYIGTKRREYSWDKSMVKLVLEKYASNNITLKNAGDNLLSMTFSDGKGNRTGKIRIATLDEAAKANTWNITSNTPAWTLTYKPVEPKLINSFSPVTNIGNTAYLIYPIINVKKG